MNKQSAVFTVLLIAAALALPGVGTAQTFTVAKFSLGGDGGTDYLTAEAGTGRVFVSRGTHVMVVDGATGLVVGDIPDTPRAHGIALAPRSGHGFITNGGDSTVTMFDLKTLAVIKKIPIATGGLDGIMYDDFSDRIILTNHSRPIGTAVALDANSGAIVGTAQLEDNAPEGAASDGKGKIFVNNEDTSTMQVLDVRTMKVLASWPLSPCVHPTGIAYDRATNRIFAGCRKTSVVIDATTGKVVATIANGDGVDALGWDPAAKLIYIPAGRDSNVTVVHEDSPDRYTVVATVATMRGAKTIAVDPVKHVAYLFQPEYGPSPPPAPGSPPPAPGTFPPRGPVIAAWFFAINHARTAPAPTSRHTLVAVFAHPDDERIVGPILARYAREGHDVYLVIATDGRKGVREHAGIPAGDSLAQVRAGEARCAARELGIHPPALLGFEDAGLATFESLEGLRTKVDSILRALQPDAVISFGPEGGTGHPDHRLVGDVVTEVIQTGGPGIPAALYYPSLPAELMKDAPPARPTVTAVPERYLSVAVPFTPADLEAGRREFACHRTQYTPTEMDAINRYLAHGWNGAVRLRPWNGGGERRTSVFDR